MCLSDIRSKGLLRRDNTRLSSLFAALLPSLPITCFYGPPEALLAFKSHSRSRDRSLSWVHAPDSHSEALVAYNSHLPLPYMGEFDRAREELALILVDSPAHVSGFETYIFFASRDLEARDYSRALTLGEEARDFV